MQLLTINLCDNALSKCLGDNPLLEHMYTIAFKAQSVHVASSSLVLGLNGLTLT